MRSLGEDDAKNGGVNSLRYESQNRPQLLGAGRKLAASSHFKVGLKSCGGMHHEFVFSTLLVAAKL